MARILVTGDDELAAALRGAGHEVVSHNGSALDLAVVRGLEPVHGTPTILLTARGHVIDAFAAGADDVVAMPVSHPELIARVEAILRRTRPVPPVITGRVLAYADVVLDEARREVTRAGIPIELTGTEFDLLRYFLEHPQRVLSKRRILASVWDSESDRRSNVVETYVGYLRRKLAVAGPPLIKTVRQAGYMLELSADSQ